MPPEIMNLLAVFVRQMLIVGFTAMAARGWIKSEDAGSMADTWAPVIVPMIPVALTMAYGLWNSTLRQKMKSILSRDKVTSIHVTPDLAAKIALPDVVPSPPASK